MGDGNENQPKRRLGDITIGDLLGGIGSTGGMAGWVAIAVLVAQFFGCSAPTLPGKVPPLIKPPLRADVPNAIGRITIGNVGCTATIIGPVEDDDREIAVLTAAHCIKLGSTGSMKLKDGRTFNVKCVSRDAASDAAWLIGSRPEGNVPFAFLASKLPNKGDSVWHQGYGIDKPGNLEQGTFEGITSDGRQCVFTLSVSSGDSGGGIIATSDGHVISPVCCTSTLSGRGRVMGATPANAAAIRPGAVALSTEEDMYRPILILPNPAWD